MATSPLAGIKVLDLSRVLAGPLCTMLLGDLGADVIKVERPERGDDTRQWGPPFDDRGESAYYLSVNRNKLSLAADLRDPSERDVVLNLIGTADVVVENFLPGALDRVGLSSSTAMRENSNLIWCSMSGFGATSKRPGYDFVVQAESGWMAITGDPDGAPMKVGVALADVVAGKDAALAIVAALAARARALAFDRRISISLADSARAALVNVAQNSLVTGTAAKRWGNAHANLVPYQLFETQDRPIVIAVGNDEQWRACVDALGTSELCDDIRIATNAGRLAHRDQIVQSLQRQLFTRPAAEWIRRLDEAKVPCGVVKTVLEAIADSGSASPLTGMPSSVGGDVRLPPPLLNEHGAVIRKLGWQAFRNSA
jgi:crotonobetainyl-CoA:carnitine CoA-transferase CaiB-like acyl-CoA transferase